ncbi:SpoIIE family protein phosphatase [Actinomadura rubrisoli]|uniref:protein-serine/threonine phosphatase n=1 Tax=Actinomadura rubrisoli TaxID=2530368 RepID=A0A4R5BAH1_9ACTN|nr:SpoIIE family protein phosphatase [Actinomadura rubrisoli]TDD83388.1 hypothetical protein E1298_21345 [Actinomadura rubrisoli]
MSGHVLHSPGPISEPSGSLIGLSRMVLLALDGRGRVLHWDPGAERLFGHPAEVALGRVFGELFGVPGGQGAALDPAQPGPVQATAFSAPLLRRAPLKIKNVSWWVYRLPAGRPAPEGHDGHDGLSVLAFATETASLRSVSLGLTVGDQLVVRSAGEPEPHRGLRVPSVAPYVLPVEPRHLPRLQDNLTEVLDGLDLPAPDGLAELTGRILDLGYPAISFIVGARLPFDTRDGLVSDETILSARAAPEGLAFLSRAGARIGSRLDPSRTAEELAGAVVPRLADLAEVHVVDDVLGDSGQGGGGSWVVRRLARSSCGPPGGQPDPEPVELPADGLLATALDAAAPVHLLRADAAKAFGEPVLRPFSQAGALTVIPLVARGTVVGALLLGHEPSRRPSGQDLAVAEEVARLGATCIADAALLARESRAAQELQRSLLPSTVPDLPAVEIRYRYLPGSPGAQVGGDWFDALPLPRGRVALTIGDVMGHGWRSAATMGRLRTAIHAFASLDLRPRFLLRKLDDVARTLGGGCFATCLYAVYEPETRLLRIANAGHIPPILIDPAGACRSLRVPSGVPIGVGGHAFGLARVEIEEGSRLVMCTDGLVERSGQDIDVRLDFLRARLSGPQRTLDELCDTVVGALRADERRDDVTLLAAEFRKVCPDTAR